ncbi:MAG: hypothetical protein HYT37_04220 [Candidatus Sungbacteria bacterium]|nr:hypothetical protein [Candidatus Sungbacteria bacterium]
MLANFSGGFVFAQETSDRATGARDGALPAADAVPVDRATSTPRAEAGSTAVPVHVPPRGAPSEATPAPVPLPAPTATQVALPVEAPLESEQSTSEWYLYGTLASAVALGSFGMYRLLTKKQPKKEKNDEGKEDGKRCFDVRQMMEDKIKEITDLRGRLEGKIKEKARETVRDLLKDTPEGEVLAMIEHAEKEYKKLKKLYTQCIIDMKLQIQNNVIIELHVPDFARVKDFYGKLGFEIAGEDKKGEYPGYLVMKRKDVFGNTLINFYGDDERIYDQSYFKRFDRKTPPGYAVGITIPVSDIRGFYSTISQSLKKYIVQELAKKIDGKRKWHDFRLQDPYGFYIRITDVVDWGQ